MKAQIFLLFILSFFKLNAQSYNDDKTALTNFVMRMYCDSKFEGVKVIVDPLVKPIESNYKLKGINIKVVRKNRILDKILWIKGKYKN